MLVLRLRRRKLRRARARPGAKAPVRPHTLVLGVAVNALQLAPKPSPRRLRHAPTSPA